MIRTSHGRARHKIKGMTLVELAIAMATIGIVLGGLWAIISAIWENNQINRAQQQIITVAQNIRDYYGPIGAIATTAGSSAHCSDGASLNDVLDDDKRRLFPVEMRQIAKTEKGAINHALSSKGSSTFIVTCRNIGYQGFRVELNSLKKAQCAKLLMQFPYLMPEMGVKRIAGTSSADIDVTNVANPGSSTLPDTAARAASWCTSAEGTNKILIDFKLRN